MRGRGEGGVDHRGAEGFCAGRGALNFVRMNEKLKFEANEKAINRMGLKASSQLLKLNTNRSWCCWMFRWARPMGGTFVSS